MNKKDLLSEDIISKLLEDKICKSKLHIFDSLNSTNSFAKELIKSGNCHQSLIVADCQTQGRGRLGREFYSPLGTGIYMTIIIDPAKIKIPSSHITIAAGVSVCRVIEALCKKNPQIKWVNDIFIDGKKVCGILAENVSGTPDGPEPQILVGIGINVSTEVFPGELSALAGSLFPKGITRNKIIASIFSEFKGIYDSSQVDDLITEYKNRSLLLGKEISFSLDGKTFFATAKDITKEGHLVAVTAENSEIILKSGEVSLRSSNFI